MTATFVLLRYMLHRFTMTDTWWVAGGSCFRACEVLPTSCKAFAGALLKLAYATVVCTFLITFSSGELFIFVIFCDSLDSDGIWTCLAYGMRRKGHEESCAASDLPLNW